MFSFQKVSFPNYLDEILCFSPDSKRIAFFEHTQKNDDRGSVNIVDLEKTKRRFRTHIGASADSSGRLTARKFFSASLSGGNYVFFSVALNGTRRIADNPPAGCCCKPSRPMDAD